MTNIDFEARNREMFAESADYLTVSRKSFDPEFIQKISHACGLRDGDRLLDVGCGTGFLGSALMATVNGGELVGVDASEELVAHAKRLQHGEFLVGDAYTLPFGPDEFDVSVCQTLLIHLSDPIKALREMVRVTKPGGRVCVVEPIWHLDGGNRFAPGDAQQKHEEELEALRFEFAIKERAGIDPYVARRTPHLLKQAGLYDIKVASHNLIRFFERPVLDDTGTSNKPIELGPYERMLAELGYDEERLYRLQSLRRQYRHVEGEFTLNTLLIVVGRK